MKHGISPTTSTALRRGRMARYLWVSSAVSKDGRRVRQQGTFSAGRNRAKAGKSGRRAQKQARNAQRRVEYQSDPGAWSDSGGLTYRQWCHSHMREPLEQKEAA